MGDHDLLSVQARLDGYLFAVEEIVKLKDRLNRIEASEERLAEIVKRSLGLKIYAFEDPRCFANGYYIDAKVALEQRPKSEGSC